MTFSEIVPLNITDLLPFESYIRGGYRKLNVPDADIDDRVQDLFMHCMNSEFFVRVKEKVDEGLMDAKQFRAYLGTTLRNCLVNGYNKDNRNPSIGAVSTATSTDEEDSRGTIDLDRMSVDSNIDFSIPSDVMESDVIRFIADYKPGFLPTFILRLMGYRPADISRIIGKRKETIHYRIKSLHALLEEYLSISKDADVDLPDEEGKVWTLSTGPSYQVEGDNPFGKGDVYWHLFETLKAIDKPVTIREITLIVGRLTDQGKITTNQIPEEVAGKLVAYALERHSISEVAASTNLESDSGGRVASTPRIRYKFVSDANPYKQWGGGHPIFESLKSRVYFDFNDLYQCVEKLIEDGAIATRRPVDSVCWGFIETARAYGAIDRAEEHPIMPGEASITVNVVTVIERKNDNTVYHFVENNPYSHGINFAIWIALDGLGSWARKTVDEVAAKLLEEGVIESKRSPDWLAYHFFNVLEKKYEGYYKSIDSATVSNPVEKVEAPPKPTYKVMGDNPFKRGINYSLWCAVVDKVFTLEDVETEAASLIKDGSVVTCRPADQLGYHFLNTLQRWYPNNIKHVSKGTEI